MGGLAGVLSRPGWLVGTERTFQCRRLPAGSVSARLGDAARCAMMRLTVRNPQDNPGQPQGLGGQAWPRSQVSKSGGEVAVRPT